MVHMKSRADVAPSELGGSDVHSDTEDTEQLTQAADVFDLLSDPRRLALLVELLAGERIVGDLAAATGASESATSHALRLLRAHRVVAVRRAGRLAYYRLTDDHVRQLLDVALAHVEHATPLHDTAGGHG
jgi:ArsR family transcriptional regulator, lead/cadmium/zinc/bismuth-responsive transcriptional repressor